MIVAETVLRPMTRAPRLCLLTLVASLSAVMVAQAQSDATVELPSIESLDERRDAIKASTDIDPDDSAQILELIGSARDTIREANERAAQVTRFKDLAARETEIREDIERQREALLDVPTPPEDASLERLEQAQKTLEAERTALASRLTTLQGRQRLLQTRDAAITGEINEANQAAERLQDDAALQLVPTLNTVQEARALVETVKRQDRLQAVDDLQAELATIPARLLIVDARIDLLTRQIATLDRQAGVLTERVAEAELQQAVDLLATAGQQVQRAEQDAPGLVQAAQRNQRLARELLTLTNQDIPDTGELRQQVLRIGEIRGTVKRILDQSAVSDAIAELLRTLREDLPSAELLERQIAASEDRRTRLEFQLILWQEEERHLATDVRADDLPARVSRMHRTVIDALIERAQVMTGANRTHETLLIDALQRTESLNTLLDRNSLWLRNSEPVSMQWVWNLGPGALWLADPDSWRGAVQSLLSQLALHPWQSLMLLLFAIYLITRRRALNRRLDELATRVGRVGEDTYWSTPFAIAISALLALPLPFLMGWASFLLGTGSTESDFESAFAAALSVLSTILFALLLFRVMCRSQGVFAAHFGWSERARKTLRKHLTWFSAWQSICTLIFVLTVMPEEPSLRYGVAVLAFIIASLGISVFGFVFFRPVRGIVYRIFEITEATISGWLICIVLVLLPLGIGLLPLLGYFDTAIDLQSRMFYSGMMLLCAAVVYGLFVRVYMVAQRRYALARARKKLMQARAARMAGLPEAAGDATPMAPLNEQVDQETIDTQSRNLLRVISALVLFIGLLFIWSDFLPALGIAQDIVLWQSASLFDGTVSVEPVSLWNLILSVSLIVGAIIVVRNIRGPLEVTLFERMKLGAGERYAAITIIGYLDVHRRPGRRTEPARHQLVETCNGSSRPWGSALASVCRRSWPTSSPA